MDLSFLKGKFQGSVWTQNQNRVKVPPQEGGRCSGVKLVGDLPACGGVGGRGQGGAGRGNSGGKDGRTEGRVSI